MKSILSAMTILLLVSFVPQIVAQDLKSKPNIIIINLDDADHDILDLAFSEKRDYFPNMKEMVLQGSRFNNLHVTTPLCGPSRACLMRGQYAHNTGIFVNQPNELISRGFEGSYERYKQLGYTNDDIGVWMRQAGYRTMMIGKYLHSNFNSTDQPNGWHEFYASVNNFYYGTKRSINGKSSTLPDGLYRTTAEFNDARRLIRIHQRRFRSKSGMPFFLYLAPHAPHLGNDSMTEKKYENIWSTDEIENTPDFYEEDMSDKPRVYQNLRPASEISIAARNAFQRDRLRSVRSVDDQIGRLIRTLKDLGEFENTYIILTSDNGYQMGHHRMTGKVDPYQRNSNVPMVVIGPNVAKNVTVNHLIAHIDITSTVLDLGNAAIPDFVDGKSFAPLLPAPEKFNERSWRKPVIIENWTSKTYKAPDFAEKVTIDNAYVGMRTFEELYVERSTGEFEYYNLRTDPFQLENSYKLLPQLKKDSLANTLALLRDIDSKPTIRIDAPFYDTVSNGFSIGGLAQDNEAVRSVFFQLYDATTREYWDGNKFQASPKQVRARISSRNGLISDWSYQFPKFKNRGSHLFRLSVLVNDNEKNKTQLSETVKTFRMEMQKPISVLSTPEAGAEGRTPTKITGSSTDNIGVASINFVIQNKEDLTYWTGTEWQKQKFEINLRNKNPAPNQPFDWSFNFKPKRRSVSDVRLSVYAEDVSGNIEVQHKNRIEFSVR